MNSDFEIVNGVLIEYHGKDKKVIIPDTVIAIGRSSFYGLTFIEEIIIPNSVRFIGARAISCMGDKFVKIVIPESVEDIDYLAFDCDDLKEVYILNPNVSIFPDAFDHCYELTDIYFAGSDYEWERAIMIDEDSPEPRIDYKTVTMHYFYKK